MTFELCFMRHGNFLGGSGNVIWEWEGNGNEIQQSWEWEWELLHGNGREWESKTHSRTPLYSANLFLFCYKCTPILRMRLLIKSSQGVWGSAVTLTT